MQCIVLFSIFIYKTKVLFMFVHPSITFFYLPTKKHKPGVPYIPIALSAPKQYWAVICILIGWAVSVSRRTGYYVCIPSTIPFIWSAKKLTIYHFNERMNKKNNIILLFSLHIFLFLLVSNVSFAFDYYLDFLNVRPCKYNDIFFSDM